MVKQGPLFIPFCVPMGYYLIHFNSLGGLNKIPFYLFDSSWMSSFLVLLTFWLFQYIFIFNRVLRGSLFHLQIVSLLYCIIFFFSCKNILYFYCLFEFSMVPTFFMIFYFGYQPEKINACLYFSLYTVVCSLPLLVCILNSSKSIFFFSSIFSLNIAMSLAFMVKTPMFLLHIWLPKAHVEAPVAGSMVLASILLKLGSYGFFLIGLSLSNSLVLEFFMYISILGMVMCSMSCFRSSDIKLMIAYSSVVHMGIVTASVVLGLKSSISAGFMMVVAHGFCSPMMFAIANVIYEKSHSRAFALNKGVFVSAILSFCLFFILSANMAVPPSLNLWSELLFMSSLPGISVILLPLVGVAAFAGVLFNLYLYISLCHGKWALSKKSSDLNFSLNLISGPLWCYLCFLVLPIYSL